MYNIWVVNCICGTVCMIMGISEPLSLLFYLAPSGWRWKVVLGSVISIVWPISLCWRASDSDWLRCLTSTMLLARLWKCPLWKVNPVMVCSPPGHPSPSTWPLLSCTLSSCGNVLCFILSASIILFNVLLSVEWFWHQKETWYCFQAVVFHVKLKYKDILQYIFF